MDRMPATPDLNQERLDQLRAIMPDLFTNDGALNPDELKRLVDPDLVPESERFEFRWFGKADAKRNAFTPTLATLEYDQERSVNPELAEGNAIIEGENLEVLKCLLASYRNRIKCIYIDPPYNKDKDFVYSDVWKVDKETYWEHIGVTSEGVKVDTNTKADGRFHSNWLNMLYPRLLMARQLLSEDGVIFISIDDSEVHNLRKMCDEVFGEENFFAQIIIRANSRGQTFKQIAKTHEYLVAYTATPETDLMELAKNGDQSDLTMNDQLGPFNTRELRNRNPKFGKHNRPNLYYPIWIDPTLADDDGFYMISLEANNRFTEVVEPKNSQGIDSCWRWGKPKTLTNIGDDTLSSSVVAKRRTDGTFMICEKYRKSTYKPKSVWSDNTFLTETGTAELRELKLGSAFDFPKPTAIPMRCAELALEDEEIMLDFFAGSGTTGHAVMALNALNNGSRRFILVQIPELISDHTEAYKEGFRKVSDVTIERNKRTVAQLEKEALASEIKANGMFSGAEIEKTAPTPGFKVFRLVKSRFPRVDFVPDPDITDEENLEALDAYIYLKEAAFLMTFNRQQILDEVLLKNGFMLNVKTEILADFTENVVFRAWDLQKEATVCLDQDLKEQTIAKLKGMDGILICLEQALDTTKKWNLRVEFGERLVAF